MWISAKSGLNTCLTERPRYSPALNNKETRMSTVRTYLDFERPIAEIDSKIAELRTAAESTVRAQLTRVFAKSGAASRAQFVALFVEDLLDGGATRA